MIVYGEREDVVSSRALLAEAERIADAEERLIRYGQWEAAAVDALCPEVDDDIDPRTAVLPETLRIRPQEGFAYYSLYPEQYRQAARRFAATERPHACVVIGIRSIGTPLSSVVAEALPCPVWRFTVRPRGHPFDRRIVLSPGLERTVRERNREMFLVVDEGPGLSGSSFTSVAEKLNELGVPDERIVFFPSYEPDVSSLVSERARARWPRHRSYVEPFRAGDVVPHGARDLSGGLWREVVACDAAVQPQHERRKYLDDGVLWKFAGLAHYGRAKLQRACDLFSESFVPQPLGFENGFILSRWAEGTPACGIDEALLDTMARYLACLSERYDTGRPADTDKLVEMIRVNTGLECAAPVHESTTVAVDGRMLPQEWIRTARGWIKTDALDHHDDHFFPGCQDIAWDIAGAAVEFEFDAYVLAERFLRLRPDRKLVERLSFYRTAYLAYRIGYATLAEQTVSDSRDAQRFADLRNRYRRLLPPASGK
jgi:hypothetical protein